MGKWYRHFIATYGNQGSPDLVVTFFAPALNEAQLRLVEELSPYSDTVGKLVARLQDSGLELWAPKAVSLQLPELEYEGILRVSVRPMDDTFYKRAEIQPMDLARVAMDAYDKAERFYLECRD